MTDQSFQIPLYNRETQSYETEQVFEQGFMDFFYGHPLGRILEYLLIQRKGFSKLYGWLQAQTKQKKIRAFVEKYQIDCSEMAQPLDSFANFPEFFIRQLKPEARPIDPRPKKLISPADARLLALPLSQDKIIPVKGQAFSLYELLKNRSLSQSFAQGLGLIFRLAPVDYHRFAYIDTGHHGPHAHIKGRLRTVSPYALHKGLAVFPQNERQYIVLNTQNFGPVIHLDVGALVVGKIIQHFPSGTAFQRGQEKGYFQLGGSTVILIFPAHTVTIDQDIWHASLQGIETLVKYGSAIGERKDP